MKNNRKPEIRFLGYTEGWVQRKLDSIVDRVKSYSLSRDVETSEYTGYKYIHYGDIHTKVADVIDESSNLPNIKAGNYELLEKGDLVLADASEDYQGIATPAVITIDIPYKLVSGLHTIALRPKQVDPLFLYYLINSPTFRKYGYKTGTGMKVFGISVTNLLKFEGMFPLLEEQTKIGNFLKQLDDTIALQQQELTTLKQTKQGFLQKMFPKEGESVPEVRFPGFTGNWEERKMGEVATFINGRAYKQHELLNSGKYKVLRVGNFYTNNSWYYSDLELGEKYYAEKGDLLYTWSATFGPHIWYGDKVIYHYHIWKVGLSDNLDKQFTIQLLEYDKAKILSDKNGSTMVHITKKGMEEKKVLLPSLEEQTKIGNFFKQLDDAIAFHQRELEALKETKKAFLQKMFV
ncbi:restriction endonuclease subunit S [Bacillus thuringiensis]|uniref:restriction endonuclease subunit S n=1 Tax=Bacillus thuringiensis TaxID=1428 RepID=UPI003BF65A7A